MSKGKERCSIFIFTSVPNVFIHFYVSLECSYSRYCILSYLIWSGSNTVCLRAAQAPTSLWESHCLTTPQLFPQLTGKDPFSKKQVGSGCKELVVCGRACTEVTVKVLDILNVHWRQNFPQFRSGSWYILSSPPKDKSLKPT